MPSSPSRRARTGGSDFGAQVAACNFTEDEAVEVLVGRQDRLLAATQTLPDPPNPAPFLEPQGGSAVVFRGTWLHDLLQGEPYDEVVNPSGTLNRVHQPPWPDKPESEGGLDAVAPEYQVLRNPMGDFQPNELGAGNKPRWADAFGWFVFNGGDLGSRFGGPAGGDFDGYDAAVVYAEETDFIGSGTLGGLPGPEVEVAGGLWVYHGTGASTGPMVHDDVLAEHDHGDALLILRPLDVGGGPQTGGRFGRSFARLNDWPLISNGAGLPAILIGESSAIWNGMAQAGLVVLSRLPLPGPQSPPWQPLPLVNAWGSTPLTEPVPSDPLEQGPRHLFGSWFAVLNYKPDPVVPGSDPPVPIPSEEFIVSSRQAAVGDGMGGVAEQAGRAFPYLPGGGP
jgi:hypothetical protein